MNFGGHVEVGWLLAHSRRFSAGERRLLVIVSVLPDIDGIFVFYRPWFDAFHRTFGHNVWIWIAVPLAVFLFAPRVRRLTLSVFSALAISLHYVLDILVTGWWIYEPFWPFRGHAILMSTYIPENVMKYGLQCGLLIVFTAGVVWIYVKRKRTPLEVISPAFDRLIMNFLLMPWRHRCHQCGCWAFYRCGVCGAALCPLHRRVGWRLDVSCRGDCQERPSNL